MITITALLRAKAGHEDTVQAALLEIAGHVAREEPGTIGYHICRARDDPALFTTYERFTDAAAMDRHNDSAALAHFVEVAGGLLDGEVTIHIGEEISVK